MASLCFYEGKTSINTAPCMVMETEPRKVNRAERGSETSTDGSADSGSDSDDTVMSEGAKGAKIGGKFCNEFMCPHCRINFSNAESLDRHDKCMDMPSDVAPLFVGANVSGGFHCADCSQKFDTERALSLHCKFMHDSTNVATAKDAGYTLVYEFDQSKLIAS